MIPLPRFIFSFSKFSTQYPIFPSFSAFVRKKFLQLDKIFVDQTFVAIRLP
jgi:hypothetical protein